MESILKESSEDELFQLIDKSLQSADKGCYKDSEEFEDELKSMLGL